MSISAMKLKDLAVGRLEPLLAAEKERLLQDGIEVIRKHLDDELT